MLGADPVISITDGQIYLESDLFHSGIRPAIHVGNSVSRVGGNAQIKAMKQVAGRLRLDLAQYRELAAFAQFGSDLDKATQAQLARGERLTEILKQDQYEPLAVEKQILVIYATTRGYTDDFEVSDLAEFEESLYAFFATRYSSLLQGLIEKGTIDDEMEKQLNSALEEFKEHFSEKKAEQSETVRDN